MAEIRLANTKSYKQAIALLSAGQSIALPTETVYGLAALANNQRAIKALFGAKKRDLAHPLSICVFTPKQAEEFCYISPLAKRLMAVFWPGPLTLVLPKKPSANISPFAHAHLPHIGIRCPDIEWREGFTKLGFNQPLVLTSANISGQSTPLTAYGVNTAIGAHIKLILDGGPCHSQLASSVVAIDNDKAKLLRAGALSPEHFAHLSIEWQS